MSGEDRQQFARDAHQRMLDREADARTLAQHGRHAEAKKALGMAAMARRQRDEYDDAGEFAAFNAAQGS